MGQPADRKIYLVLDFDECLFDHPEGLEPYFGVSYGETAIRLGCPLPRDEAIALARKSFQERGLSHYMFEKFGIDIKQLYNETHPYFFENYVLRFKDVISQYNNAAYFDNQNIEAAILTDGTTYWAQANLELMNLKKFFPDERIIGSDLLDYTFKHETKNGFLMALKSLGLTDDDLKEKRGSIFFVDDSVKNLKIPHDMGFHTVQVKKKTLETTHLEFIDYQYPTLWGFLDDLYAGKIS